MKRSNTQEILANKTTFIFDVDGTLTPPNKPMEMQFMRWFERWMVNSAVSVVLCTSNTFESISERLGRKIIEQSRIVFSCAGSEVYGDGKKAILNDWRPSLEVVQLLDQLVKDNGFKIRSGPNIEYRTGMISFSVVGKAASDADREKYKTWDHQTKDRNKIVNLLKEKFPNLFIIKSGETSIDISNTNKSQIMKYFMDEKYLWIFGNEFDTTGNDRPIQEMLEKNNIRSYNIKKVVSDQDTFSILRKLTI